MQELKDTASLMRQARKDGLRTQNSLSLQAMWEDEDPADLSAELVGRARPQSLHVTRCCQFFFPHEEHVHGANLLSSYMCALYQLVLPVCPSIASNCKHPACRRWPVAMTWRSLSTCCQAASARGITRPCTSGTSSLMLPLLPLVGGKLICTTSA